jgi:hypothetical protein
MPETQQGKSNQNKKRKEVEEHEETKSEGKMANGHSNKSKFNLQDVEARLKQHSSCILEVWMTKYLDHSVPI